VKKGGGKKEKQKEKKKGIIAYFGSNGHFWRWVVANRAWGCCSMRLKEAERGGEGEGERSFAFFTGAFSMC